MRVDTSWRFNWRGLVALAGALQCGGVQAQAVLGPTDGAGLGQAAASSDESATGTRRAAPVAWRLESSVMVSDNLGARPSAQGKDGGLMVRVTPGVRYAHRGPQAQWQVDYSLQGQRYVRTEQQGKPFQNNLRAGGNAQLFGSALTLEGQASIAQRTRSAFDVQRTFGESALGEASEVGTLSLGPSLKWRMGEQWRGRLSHIRTVTRVRGTQTGDGNGQNTQLTLEQAQRALLTWGAQFSHQASDAVIGRDSATSQARLNLTWKPDVDWSVGGHGGRERSNLQSTERATGALYGLNVAWSPTPRTRAQMSGEHRVVGNFHTLSLDHRFSRAAIRFSDSRTVNQAGFVGGTTGTTNYELIAAQLGTQVTDPVERDLLVRQRLAELGLSPDALVANGFLSSQPSVSRSRLLGLTYQQPRALWTLNLTQTRTSRLVAGGLGSEDLANSAFVQSNSAQGGLTYRLTPMSAVRLQASWQRNEGENAALQRNELRTLVVGWQWRLGPSVQVATGLRHTEFDSPARPFTENAVLLTVEQRL